MTWLLWAFVLMAQNASTTWASRARNSGSVGYHAIASVFSNGVWFISFTILTDSVLKAAAAGSIANWLKLFVFYTTFTVLGATLAHWASMAFLEKGNRAVGYR